MITMIINDDDRRIDSYSLREMRVDHHSIFRYIYSIYSDNGKRFYDQATKFFPSVD